MYTEPRWVPKNQRAAAKAEGQEGCLDKDYTDVLVRAASKRLTYRKESSENLSERDWIILLVVPRFLLMLYPYLLYCVLGLVNRMLSQRNRVREYQLLE